MIDKYQRLLQEVHRSIDSGRIRLPSFPENLLKIRQALHDPHLSTKKLAELVHTDAVLASRIFALGNSAAYALNTKDMSLLNVMQMIGLNMVRSSIYNYCLGQLFSDRKFKRISEVSRFVRNRSLEIAGINYAIAQKYHLGDSATALLSGLLHNIGALVVISWLAQNPSRVSDIADQKAMVVAGQQQFGLRVVEEWRIPEHLKRVIILEEGVASTRDPECLFVHLVDVSRWISRLLRHSKTIEDPPLSALALFNLDVDDILQDKDEILADMIKIIQAIR